MPIVSADYVRALAGEAVEVEPAEEAMEVGGLGVVVKLTRKGLPAVSWHWQALPKTFFF